MVACPVWAAQAVHAMLGPLSRTSVSRVDAFGWRDCVRLSNDSIELCDGWAFVKAAGRRAGPRPDRGSAVEVFGDQGMTELETLGPLVDLAPQAHVDHVEAWRLLRLPGVAGHDDEGLILDALSDVGEAVVARATGGLR